MCGIIGYSPIRYHSEIVSDFCKLLFESRVRGTHAYGIAYHTGNEIHIYKEFDLDAVAKCFNPTYPSIAHTRYCQSGDWRVMENNQPLDVNNIVGAVNGVLHMGTKEEFEQAFGVKCNVDNDSEVFLQLVNNGIDPEYLISNFTGSFAGVWLSRGMLYAGHNERRPLWTCLHHDALWFASTRDIFERAGFKGAQSVVVNKVIEI